MIQFPFPQRDIKSDMDVHLLVKAFSKKAKQNPLFPRTYNEATLASDEWMMASFWCSALFDSKPFQHHHSLEYAFLLLPTEHIGQWIHLFFLAIDENFKGEIADKAKARAANMAHLTRLQDVKRKTIHR
ncbi:hypothetical protein [Sabulibacter ruber]|uniref:hypothetical protein n=1 Tax=Sabulibacter ruber TaxID=2811901 RepID=UPI001A96AFA6|nr:hypothetical protein [Sabulibacter ruber]